MKRFIPLAAVAYLALAGSSAQANLGITVKAHPGGGIQIKTVTPGGVGDDLGLKAGEIILTMGNPDEGVPDMLVNTHKEAQDALLQSGDHIRMLVLNGTTFSFVEGDLQDDVSLEEDLQFVSVAADRKVKEDKSKDKASAKKPPTVTAHLSKVAKPAKTKVKVVPGSVKRTKTTKPAWHKGKKDPKKDPKKPLKKGDKKAAAKDELLWI